MKIRQVNKKLKIDAGTLKASGDFVDSKANSLCKVVFRMKVQPNGLGNSVESELSKRQFQIVEIDLKNEFCPKIVLSEIGPVKGGQGAT